LIFYAGKHVHLTVKNGDLSNKHRDLSNTNGDINGQITDITIDKTAVKIFVLVDTRNK
jgi:hypothetical protein